MPMWFSCEHCAQITEARWDSAAGWRCDECATLVTPPPPGSLDATLEGCTCDRDANNGGRVMPEQGWLTSAGCPIHDPADPTGSAA